MAEKKQHFWIDRRHTRIGTFLPCMVAAATGKPAQAQMLNLSAGGMKFSCSHAVFTELLPDSQRTPGLIQDVVIKIEFQLDTGDKQAHVIRCQATIIHTERLAQDCFHIGIEFRQLPDSDIHVVQQFIAQLSRS